MNDEPNIWTAGVKRDRDPNSSYVITSLIETAVSSYFNISTAMSESNSIMH